MGILYLWNLLEFRSIYIFVLLSVIYQYFSPILDKKVTHLYNILEFKDHQAITHTIGPVTQNVLRP